MSRPSRHELARRLMVILAARHRRRGPEGTPRPARAIAIARWLDIRPNGNRESRRRGVRQVVNYMRDELSLPVLTEGDGYYLGSEMADFIRAECFERRSGLQRLANASQLRSSAGADDAAGQYQLDQSS